jgi:hypothetical protein
VLTYRLTADGKFLGTVKQNGEYAVAEGVDRQLAGWAVQWSHLLLGNNPLVNSATYRHPSGTLFALHEVNTVRVAKRYTPPPQQEDVPRAGAGKARPSKTSFDANPTNVDLLKRLLAKKISEDEFEKQLV